MAARAIPEAVEESLAALAAATNPATGRRWTCRELSAWLLAEHRIRASHAAVAAALQRARSERHAAVAEAIREAVCGSLELQLRDLDQALAEFLNDARSAPTCSDRARSAGVVIQGLAMKLRFAGLAERPEVADEAPDRPESPRDVLARRVDELAARRGSGGAAGGG